MSFSLNKLRDSLKGFGEHLIFILPLHLEKLQDYKIKK